MMIRVTVEYEGDVLTGTKLPNGSVLVDSHLPLWGGITLSPEDYGNRIILPDTPSFSEPLADPVNRNGKRSHKSRMAQYRGPTEYRGRPSWR